MYVHIRRCSVLILFVLRAKPASCGTVKRAAKKKSRNIVAELVCQLAGIRPANPEQGKFFCRPRPCEWFYISVTYHVLPSSTALYTVITNDDLSIISFLIQNFIRVYFFCFLRKQSAFCLICLNNDHLETGMFGISRNVFSKVSKYSI